MKQLAFDLVAPASPTLDNFLAGRRNQELVERLRELSHAPQHERSVYIWGAPVSGRTHLLRATVAELERNGVRAAYFANGEALQRDNADIDGAAVDDVHLLDDAGESALFRLFNRLRESGGVLVAGGDVAPGALRLRADVVTRLAWGLVYELHALGDSEKLQALVQHAAARGFDLAPDVAEYLLNRVKRDMRTLTAMVDTLDRYALETKRAITLALVREVLECERATASLHATAPVDGGAQS